MNFIRHAYILIALSAILIGIATAANAQETPATGLVTTPETAPVVAPAPAAVPETPPAAPATTTETTTPAAAPAQTPAAATTTAPPQTTEAAATATEEPTEEYESCPNVPSATPVATPVDIAALEHEAQAGSPSAAYSVANEYARIGKYPEAEKWYRFALYKGEGRAALGLYELFAAKAIKLDDAENIRNYGLNLMEEGAKSGGGGAAMNLATLYLYGQGSTKDYEKAREWFLLAEAADKPMASYELGIMYSNALYFEVAPRKAFHYFEKAAAAGIAPATRQVAIAYHTGIGAAKDLDKAITCYTRAADQGDMLAMRDLGNIYRIDRPDSGQSSAWYQKAANLGDPDSLYMLGRYQEAAKKKHHLSRVIVEPDYAPKE
jgi:uncharacterized protein